MSISGVGLRHYQPPCPDDPMKCPEGEKDYRPRPKERPGEPERETAPYRPEPDRPVYPPTPHPERPDHL